MEQRSEREVPDLNGELHQIDGQPAKGIEMALLFGMAAFLQVGFPRGVMHVDGHSWGLNIGLVNKIYQFYHDGDAEINYQCFQSIE